MNIFHWLTGERHLSAEEVVSAEHDQVESSFSNAFDARFKDYLVKDYPNFIKQTYGDYIRSNYPDISPDAYPARERPGYGLAISGGNRSVPPGFKQGKSLTDPLRDATPQAAAEPERAVLCAAA